MVDEFLKKNKKSCLQVVINGGARDTIYRKGLKCNGRYYRLKKLAQDSSIALTTGFAELVVSVAEPSYRKGGAGMLLPVTYFIKI